MESTVVSIAQETKLVTWGGVLDRGWPIGLLSAQSVSSSSSMKYKACSGRLLMKLNYGGEKDESQEMLGGKDSLFFFFI